MLQAHGGKMFVQNADIHVQYYMRESSKSFHTFIFSWETVWVGGVVTGHV